MTSLAVTVFYKERFYHDHCLPLRPNATLPDHCHLNNTIIDEVMEDSDDSEFVDKLKLLFDVWPALSVILYILGKKNATNIVKKLIKVFMIQFSELELEPFLGYF